MKRILCFFIITAFIFSTGCIEKKEKSAYERNYIVYNIGKMPEDLVMLKDEDVRQKSILPQIFEGLVKVDENGDINPGIAESWKVDEQGLTYTFAINNNACWSDGGKITANDFVNFFRSMLREKDSFYTDELNCIFGVQDYISGKKDMDSVAINAADDNSLNIRLNYPCPYFINILAQPEFVLRNLDDNLYNWRIDYKKIKYSGPFIIENISEGGDVTLSKNTKYCQSDKVKSEVILLTCTENNDISLANFEASKIDMFCNPPVQEIKRLEEDKEIKSSDDIGTGNLIFNLKKEGPVSDINFRRAVEKAIDRRKIVSSVFAGTVSAAKDYDSFSASESSEDVKKCIKSSNYNGEKITLIYPESVINKKLCETISKSLKQYAGINVVTAGYERAQYDEAIKDGSYDIAEKEYISNYDSPISLLEIWKSNSKQNEYGYKNADFDNLIDTARIAKDANAKKQLYKKCEEQLYKDMPVIPLFESSIILCRRPEIDGEYITKRGIVMLDRIYKKPGDKSYVFINSDGIRKIPSE